MAKIVYLDKPSYLPEKSISELRELGDLYVYRDKPSAQEAGRRLSEADIAIVEWTTIDRDMLSRARRLSTLVLVTTNYHKVDIVAARELNIDVCNTPGYSRQSVSEHVIAMILALSKRLIGADIIARSGDANYTHHSIGIELYGKTLGVIGMGDIGSSVAELGHCFGMKVVGCSRRAFAVQNVAQVDLKELLTISDIVAVCVSVNPSSRGLLSRERLSCMRKGSILVSISGNEVFDEMAIADLLERGYLFGAGFDSETSEALRSAPNVLVTPGTAWYTQASLDRNAEVFVETVRCAIAGHPRFVVN